MKYELSSREEKTCTCFLLRSSDAVRMRWQYSAGNTALAIQRWQYSAAPQLPRNLDVSIRINPGSMTAMNTFAKQRGPKNNKNHSPACLHVCWQRLKNTKKHQKTTWAAKTNLKKIEEDMFCSDAKTP